MTATLTSAPRHSTAETLAAATPARRDRYVDFLRAFSLAVVMLGHWLMAAVVWDGDGLRASNLLEATPWARWLTWAFQVMPVFFIVGGFANTASWTAAQRDGKGYGTWLGVRLARLVRPVLAFAAVWTVAAVALQLAGVAPAALRASSIAQPLWFLGVYVAVVAVAPAMVRAHHRWGSAVVWVLGAAVAAVDTARWTFEVPYVGWANLGLVWLFAHQLGIVWREGNRGVQATQADRGVQATQADRGVQATQADRGVQATQADRGVQATQADRGVQATQADRGVQATQADRGVQATQADRGVQATQAGVGSWSRRRAAALAVAGFAGLLLLTQAGGYPDSMVGGVGEARSNTFPPSLALAVLAVWQFGLVLAVRPVVDRWLARPRAWAAVVAANGMAMTLYLWHLTALVIVAAAVLPAGLLPSPATGSAAWWALRPVWLVLPGLALVPLVLIFGRVETARLRPTCPPAWRAAVAAALVAVGTGLLARRGFVVPGMPGGLPLVALGLLGAAWWSVTARARH